MFPKRTILFFLISAVFALNAQPLKFDLNTDVNYRTIEGVEGGNYLDISLRPTLAIAELIGTQFFVNIPYNLSTNKVRKLDLKLGNAFKYAILGNENNYIRAGAVENYSSGFSSLIVNNYNNQFDENYKKVGAIGGINLGGFAVSAMANDVGDPKVFTGSVGFDLPIMDNFKVNFTGGMDTDPDNNKATSGNAAAYGVELLSALAIDPTNYFYVVGGAGAIKDHGNGQLAMLGARFGTEAVSLNLEGSMMRLGPGFEWGFFDAFYERDRKLGFNKADYLEANNPKASGGTNFTAILGMGNAQDPSSFLLQAGGFYFTNYAGTDLNEFNGVVYVSVPRSLMGEEGQLLAATLVLKTKGFENISGLVNRLKEPDSKTIITLDAPVTLIQNLAGLGSLAFVVNYSWNYAFDPANKFYTPQKNLQYGFRLISNVSN